MKNIHQPQHSVSINLRAPKQCRFILAESGDEIYWRRVNRFQIQLRSELDDFMSELIYFWLHRRV